MDKYRRVVREKEPVGENEIRVTSTGRLSQYVGYAIKLLTEKNLRQLTIKATGNAISLAISLAEVIKRRYAGLHQITRCGVTTIRDIYEPLEEGLDKVVEDRVVSFLDITLSLDTLDTADPGYQSPLSEELIKEFKPESISRLIRPSRGRGFRSRGFRGGPRRRSERSSSDVQNGPHENGIDESYDGNHSNNNNTRKSESGGRGRGGFRGRGRRGKGRGRQE